MTMAEMLQRFEQIGAKVHVPAAELKQRLQSIGCFVFDWDGVFTDARKNIHSESTFSEADSMGLNMLRFGFWLEHGQLPFTAILSGAANPTAKFFAKREVFHEIACGVKHKIDQVRKWSHERNISTDRMAFMYDDILDLGTTEVTGFRIRVGYNDRPMFNELTERRGVAELVTASSGGQNAVREFCEFYLAGIGRFEQCLVERTAMSDTYKAYLAERNALTTIGA